MPARIKPRIYYAKDLTHTVSERKLENWGEKGEESYRLKCMADCDRPWWQLLKDTRAKDFYVCPRCYHKLFKANDWKAWEVGY